MNSTLKTIQEHQDYILVDKPAGLSVHNEDGGQNCVLSSFSAPVFPVHRLDRETSGILLLAKNKAAATSLAQSFQNHAVKKSYQAVLRGNLGAATKLQWTWPLTDKAEGRRNPQGLSKDRKPCQSHVLVVQTNPYLTWVQVEILTGRQHQIRKHAALAKHPIVGDSRYNDLSYNQKMTMRFGTQRLFLHASYLEFPWQGETVKTTCAAPVEFTRIFENAGSPAGTVL